MFKPYRGSFKMDWYPKAASTAFSEGALVYFNGSGQIIPADATSGDHVGVIQKAVASTDSDYASTTMVPVLVPVSDQCEWLVDIGTGTGATTLVGTTVDLADSLTLDVTAAAKDAVTITQHVSTTKAVVKINNLFTNFRTVTT